ncbi:MAG TPA: PAS domain S-box protein, partial [Candidatus Methanoperedens sp.]|nr:PAS domain S-box protein [Candidatus Methanoperedens sp.]
MEEKEACIRREVDRTLQEWSARAAFIGAVIFLLLCPLDFYADPPHAVRFLLHRFIIAAVLVSCGAFLRRPRSGAAIRGAVFLGVLASAATVEAMILAFGGHDSPYLIGLILLAVTTLGLIPAGPGFASLLAGTIFAVHLLPILVWDTISAESHFAVEAVLFFFVLATGVLISWLHRRRLVQEISLRYDLTRSRERLEQEAARRARAAAALRESQDLLSSMAAATVDATVMIDPEGAIRYWNPAAERIFGYAAAEVLGRVPFTFLADPEKAGELLAEHHAWQTAGAGPLSGWRVVTRGRRKSGESFPMELAMATVTRDGRLWTCALLRDATEQIRNEERLRLFAAAVEGAAEGFYIVDLNGRVLYVNPAVRAVSGREPADYIGRSVTELHANPAHATGVIMPAILRSGSWAGEIAGRTKDGHSISLWLTASLVRDEGGRPIAMVGITKDLAAQKRLEDEHIKAQKLESIGVLAGGLAHDFNNLLTIILGNLDLARLFAGANPDAAEALDHASEAALRAGDLTRQLLT